MKTKINFSGTHLETNHRWGIILAGGDGSRLHSYIKSSLGEERPKQYCALVGKRTMLRHTIDRVSNLFADDQLLTTINATHTSWASPDLLDRLKETIIVQPFNRETGPGILLPMLHVHKADPDAMVALFPADHFILQEDRFQSYIVKAFEFVSEHPDRVIALGTVPTSLQSGYGWIEIGGDTYADNIFSVNKFWEKPDTRLTHILHEKKCLWNTMILIGKSQTFMRLIDEHMHVVFRAFQRIDRSIGTNIEKNVTTEIFNGIPTVNFSRHILERIPERLCVLQMKNVYWSDWGDEARIRNDIEFLKHQQQSMRKEDIHQMIV